MCLNTRCHNMVMAAATALVLASIEARAAALPIVLPNDNTRPAGAVDSGAVTVRLRAATGTWRPEGPGGTSDAPLLAMTAR